jgi:heme/copper-type cytochrome/quinol oxidase subunit 1
MSWIDRLNIGQRVVVVVTIGLALGVVANYLTGLGPGVRTGWYAYAPLSGQVPPGLGEPGWLRLVIWLAAIGLWAVTSLRVKGRSAC